MGQTYETRLHLNAEMFFVQMALHPLNFAPFSFNVEDILSENIIFQTECFVK